MIGKSDQFPTGKTWDVCVVGSGVMGLALALTLSRRGKSVIVLEAGDEEITDQSQAFYQCQSVGRKHESSSDGRFRVFGGSSERWGGQAMRFDGIDFDAREWANAPDWPIKLDKLPSYYEKAERFLGLESPNYLGFEDEFRKLAKRLGLSEGAVGKFRSTYKFHSSAFTFHPRLREVYREELAASASVLILQGASAIRLITNGAGKVIELLLCSRDGERRVNATEYVLALGGIENARFLLLQREIWNVAEFANLQALGRFFQDHPGAHLGEIHGKIALLFQNLFRLKRRNGMFLKGRMSWTERIRRDEQLPSVSATFLLSRKASGFDDLPQINGKIWPNWSGGINALSKGILYSPLHHVFLAVSAEDVRNPQSRILLSTTEKDAFDLPKAVVDWKVSPEVVRSIQIFSDRFASLISEFNLGKFQKFSFVDNSDALMAALKDNSHHIGTTAMGTNEANGVVDQDLRILGFTNLSVVGTSVLPTGSHANPTLTALALCLRLADRL